MFFTFSFKQIQFYVEITKGYMLLSKGYYCLKIYLCVLNWILIVVINYQQLNGAKMKPDEK